MLYYEDTLSAYRTDKFAGWQNQPANGVPLFGYGSLDYTLLTPATDASPEPSAPTPNASGQPPGATPATSAAPGTPGPATATNDPTVMVLAVAVLGVLVGGVMAWRRRGRVGPDGDDDDE